MGGIRYGLGHLDTLDCTFSVFRSVVTCRHSGPPRNGRCCSTRGKYVWFRCAEGYSTSIDMATAMHPQTQMTFKYDGEILPPKYGFPMKIRIPTKLGFKNPKHVMEMAVINNWNPGYWEEQGYNWFSGI